MNLCECGCGEPTPIAQRNDYRLGHVKGQPLRFVNGHNTTVLRHGHTRGGVWTPEYTAWKSMLDRCRNPKNSGWMLYGGRGITVCAEWANFASFLADMGPRPPGHSLDRVDPDGNYAPGNVRWATAREQNRNVRTNRWLTYSGVTLCLADWAARLGIHSSTLAHRLKHWPLERALATPRERHTA